MIRGGGEGGIGMGIGGGYSNLAGRNFEPGLGPLADGRLAGHTQHQYLITARRDIGGRKRHRTRTILADVKGADLLLIPKRLRSPVGVEARDRNGDECAHRPGAGAEAHGRVVRRRRARPTRHHQGHPKNQPKFRSKNFSGHRKSGNPCGCPYELPLRISFVVAKIFSTSGAPLGMTSTNCTRPRSSTMMIAREL